MYKYNKYGIYKATSLKLTTLNEIEWNSHTKMKSTKGWDFDEIYLNSFSKLDAIKKFRRNRTIAYDKEIPITNVEGRRKV